MEESMLAVKELNQLSEGTMLTKDGFCIRPGLFRFNGAVIIPGGVSFTIHSNGATYCELALFRRREEEPFAIIPFPETFKVGNVYSMIVFQIDIRHTEYAYRMDGPYEPKKGLLFDRNKFLLDPYARLVAGRQVWGQWPTLKNPAPYRGKIVDSSFDWKESVPPGKDFRDLIIYEMHVRGFTKHSSSGVKYPGTFEGVREKIPYLKRLGINAVELMPIFEFDECRDDRKADGKPLYDYWGYNTVGFFAPNSSYAACEDYNKIADELKLLIKELHNNDIEVILDVVFNHTAEGNEGGPVISFKGIDNNLYYLLTPEGFYYNFSGCGNTLNCNNPIVNDMILECLRYWTCEYRVDGFRFDLASILGRNEDGSPMSKPPLLERLAYDPILGKVKLIAEAWDAGGLYQVGSFPSFGRWSEWNGRYRDDLRRFLKGDGGLAGAAASRMTGSLDLYDPKIRGEDASVNFLTCHDGFTLYDLYSYNQKHNEGNGWNNTDGDNNNNSWNCGQEGETKDQEVLKLRKRLIRNAAAVLMVSHGTPMFLAGDEFGNTQYGNNNAYCQDNEISWLNWDNLNDNEDIFQFFQNMISFRKEHPVLRDRGRKAECDLPYVSFHGIKPWETDYSQEGRILGILYAGRKEQDSGDDFIYVLMNMHWESHEVTLPGLPDGYEWNLTADTGAADGKYFCGEANRITDGDKVTAGPRSVQIFCGV